MEGWLPIWLARFSTGLGIGLVFLKASRPGIDGCRVGAELKSREGYAGRQEASAQILKFTFPGHTPRDTPPPLTRFSEGLMTLRAIRLDRATPASIQGSLNGAQPQRRNSSIDFCHLFSPGIYMALRWTAIRFLVKIQ